MVGFNVFGIYFVLVQNNLGVVQYKDAILPV